MRTIPPRSIIASFSLTLSFRVSDTVAASLPRLLYLPLRWNAFFWGGRLFLRPYVMDLESTNGTLLNGERLESARYIELKVREGVLAVCHVCHDVSVEHTGHPVDPF